MNAAYDNWRTHIPDDERAERAERIGDRAIELIDQKCEVAYLIERYGPRLSMASHTVIAVALQYHRAINPGGVDELYTELASLSAEDDGDSILSDCAALARLAKAGAT